MVVMVGLEDLYRLMLLLRLVTFSIFMLAEKVLAEVCQPLTQEVVAEAQVDPMFQRWARYSSLLLVVAEAGVETTLPQFREAMEVLAVGLPELLVVRHLVLAVEEEGLRPLEELEEQAVLIPGLLDKGLLEAQPEQAVMGRMDLTQLPQKVEKIMVESPMAATAVKTTSFKDLLEAVVAGQDMAAVAVDRALFQVLLAVAVAVADPIM